MPTHTYVGTIGLDNHSDVRGSDKATAKSLPPRERYVCGKSSHPPQFGVASLQL